MSVLKLSFILLQLLVGTASTGCQSVAQFSPLASVERSLIYHPRAWPDDFEVPADGPVDEVWFTAADGTRLHGLYISHSDARGVALVCHGNAGNVASHAESLEILNQRHRLSVLMFDYRGFGKSEGRPSEVGILSDARAARNWLADQEGIDGSEIIIMGRSLGGAVAVDLAARDGAKALVLASTFPSIPAVVKAHSGWIPLHWLISHRLDSIKKITAYRGPLLQSHGTTDTLIPIELARELFTAASSENKQFIQIDGGHNVPQSEAYRQALDELIDSLE